MGKPGATIVAPHRFSEAESKRYSDIQKLAAKLFIEAGGKSGWIECVRRATKAVDQR
jgi:hypothetical protein